MSGSSLSRRYALGLIKAVSSQEEYDQIKTRLQDFFQVLVQDRELRTGLETPLLSREQKLELLTLLNRKLDFPDKVVNFLHTLVEENRVAYLEEILRIMDDLWLESRGVERFTVASAVPMAPELRSRLQKRLEKALDGPVWLDFTTDPGLIAGICIRRGSVAYDFSIAGNLRKLYRHIVEGKKPQDGPPAQPSRQEI